MDQCDALSLPKLLDDRKCLSPSPVFQSALKWLLEYKNKVQVAQDDIEKKLKNMLSNQTCEESRLGLQSDLSILQGNLVPDHGGDNSTSTKRSLSSGPCGATSKKQRRYQLKKAPGLRPDEYRDLLARLSDVLSARNISLESEVHAHTRVYSLAAKDYGMRGDFPYGKPCGWIRFALEVPKEVFDDDWPIAYHGTEVEYVPSILKEGLTAKKAHRQNGSLTKKTIYCSPSVEYAAFPTYAVFDEVSNQHWMQIVLQVRVRPGKFTQQPGTMNTKHWPKDLRWEPSFDSLYAITHQPKIKRYSMYHIVF